MPNSPETRRFKMLLALLIIVGGMAFIFHVSVHEIPDSNRDFVNIILGNILGLMESMILASYFKDGQ